MKSALVLARGKGTRMQRAAPAAAADPGAVAGGRHRAQGDDPVSAAVPRLRPRARSPMPAACDVCLVIGPEHDVVREYYERTRPPERVRVSFADPAGGARHGRRRALGGGLRRRTIRSSSSTPTTTTRSTRCRRSSRSTVLVCAAFRRIALIERGNIDPDRIRSYAMLTIDDAATSWTSSRSRTPRRSRAIGDDDAASA